jgi:hypothetical protein
VSDRRLRFLRRGSESSEQELLDLLDKTIRVVLPLATPSWSEQQLALALVDLLGRQFPRIDIAVDQSAVAHVDLLPGAATLGERLQTVRANGLTPLDPSTEPVMTIAVGQVGDIPADIYVDGSGWQTYVGRKPSRLEHEGSRVPVGPLIAACRGASQVLQVVLGSRLEESAQRIEENYWSALTYESGPNPIEEPKLAKPASIVAVLVGAGSIGGACVYLLARVPGLTGELDIVDDDVLREHNPDRAILATAALAAAESVKADVAAAALTHHTSLDARPQRMRLAAFHADRARNDPLPLVLSAVDSVTSRREIQDAVPLEVIDAACAPDQVSCSAHRTDDGPCIYCLHIAAVLDSEQIKVKLISRATGFNEKAVVGLLVTKTPLEEQHLRVIEGHRKVPTGTFDDYRGQLLETLYREQFVYGEAVVETAGGGLVAVAAPFVTALAGFLLAAEALKAGGGTAYAPYRLGPSGEIGSMYRENPWASPEYRLLSNPPRWPTHECLCNSPRRLRLLRARYGL